MTSLYDKVARIMMNWPDEETPGQPESRQLCARSLDTVLSDLQECGSPSLDRVAAHDSPCDDC